MDKFLIEGGHELSGEIEIGGAKNAALPALAATLLTDEEVVLEAIPQVRDIGTMGKLLETLGAEVENLDHRYRVRARTILEPEAPYELVKTMRASSLVLGPLLARTGTARVSLPGGCAIGSRPINFHLAGLEKLGAEIRQEHGYVTARAPSGLRGGVYRFERPSVTGAEDLMMAATLARGETVLENAALEPEVSDLARLLTAMGAKIEGAGTPTIHVQGCEKLRGAQHRIIPDRIEAATYMTIGTVCAGTLTLRGIRLNHVAAVMEKMERAGVEMTLVGDECTRIRGGRPLRAVDIMTREFPGFPTDMQAQWMAMMTQAEGDSKIIETIFENRFMHALELMRMGAKIEIQGNQALVRGKTRLMGAKVMASDLRASASLVIAALAAEGQTTIDRVYHMDRGYEGIEEKLASVGAKIQRIK